MGSRARDGIAYIFKFVKCFSDRDLPILPSKKQERCGPRGLVLVKGERLSRVCISRWKVDAVPVGVYLMVLWSCASGAYAFNCDLFSCGAARGETRGRRWGSPQRWGGSDICS
jgi:hypothetical protein